MRVPTRLASLVILAAVAAAGLRAATRASSAPPTPSAPAVSGSAPAFTGAGSCAASACHGAERPRSAFRVAQNEYTVWVLKDGHAKAYAVLEEELSRRIARNLRLGEPATKTDRCLDCHAVNAPESRRGRTFVLSDGVACEACHGPAEDWLGPHTTRGWTHRQSVAAGMNDVDDVVVRARTCLGCHLGDERRQVDHELIAAGHPDLAFELDGFTAAQPAHWKDDDMGPWFGARQWAVGQAVALAESMKLLTRRPRHGGWPDFADYECFACHHGLVKNSYRVARGYTGPAGRPSWNRSRFVVFRKLLERVDPKAATGVAADLDALDGALREGWQDREAVTAAALRVATAVEPVARKLADRSFAITPDLVASVLEGIAAEADAITAAGYRAAEQAALAVDALYRPYLKNVKGKDPAAAKKAVDRLFDALGEPNRFDPAKFAAELRAVRSDLIATASAR